MDRSTKVTTVIENRTKEVLVLKVGNQNHFTKLGIIEMGAEYKLEVDVNWTYQEFSLQPVKGRLQTSKIIVSSDDCCDFERLTVTASGGKFEVDKVARGRQSSVAAAELGTKNWTRFFTWLKLHFNWRFWS